MSEPVTTDTQVLTPIESKARIDAFLTPVIAERVQEARAIEPSYEALWTATAQLFAAGGKRFRSYMTLLTFQAYSDEPIDTVIPAAAAQELLHLGVLIHDDIIDRDDIRYGTSNVTGRYLDLYQTFITDEGERRHYAESAALLAGDLLLSETYLLTTSIDRPYDIVRAAHRIIGKAIFTVVGGELLDTEAAFKKVASAHPLLIAEQKTSSYSFVAPFEMGATLAGAPRTEIDTLDLLGQKLGIGYQIRDDVIGAFGDSDVSGKSNEGDLREGKRTLLIDEFYRQASAEQRSEFDTLFGNTAARSEDVSRIRALIEESGAKQVIETMIADYHDECEQLVARLAISDEYKSAFRQLINICLQREK